MARGLQAWRFDRMASGLALAGIALGATAVLVNYRSRKAERDYPPKGRFLTVRGVGLHYVETGPADALAVVFLHGNGAMIDDIVISGLAELTAKKYRTIVFDRPGFGYSDRPRGPTWDARSQAKLIREALSKLLIDRAIVVGHSWGTLIATALALDYPANVAGLVLGSGYYYPVPRADVLLFSPPAVPIVGDIIRHTVAPMIGELMAPPLIKRMFAPLPVPTEFSARFPVSMTIRPSQIRAFAEDTSQMSTSAKAIAHRYPEINCPTVILAGRGDEIVDYRQSIRLSTDITGSELIIVDGGHMIHHSDPGLFAGAIDQVAGRCLPADPAFDAAS